MIINNNIPALNTYRQMGINTNASTKSMEKLASGLRINKAGDDAAGLAISEKMRAQVRGLDQASRNGQDGISMIQTAEGSLQETHNILQRMRELATQGANDTNVEVDRKEIQKEMNALTSEINRIGNTTEFNTQNLLDGGAKSSGVSLSSTEAKGVAATGGQITGTLKVDLTVATLPAATTDLLKIQVEDAKGTPVAMDFDLDGVAFKTLYDQTAAGKAGATATEEMKRDALVEVLGNMTSSAATFKLTDETTERTVSLKEVVDISISDNGVLSMKNKIGGSDIALDTTTSAVFSTMMGFDAAHLTAGDITGSGTAAQEATLYGSTSLKTTTELKYDDWAGKSFDVTYNGRSQTISLAAEPAATLGKSENVITADELKTAMNAALDAAFGSGAVAASIATDPNNINDTKTYFQFTTTTAGDDIVKGVAPEFSIKGDNLDKILGDFVPGTKGSGGKFEATFQIGANQGQSMTIDINDMRSQALGVSAASSGATSEVDGAKYTKSADVSNGTDSKGVEYSLDVSSHETATAAIKVINNAIESVSAERSKMGAFQNRLEHTISNLNNSSENLQAAESRIRDTDMAKEVMEMTRSNILAQASQAMLAQANQKPQSVLQLLG